MRTSPFTTLASAFIALVMGSFGFLFPAAAGAKVACEERLPQSARVELGGLPERPEAGGTYTVTADLPSGSGVNARPLLFALLCERVENGREKSYLRSIDSDEFPGRTASEGGYAFDVRFGRPGRWLIASMDVAGRFREFGFYEVGPKLNTSLSDEGSNLALALATWWRRSWCNAAPSPDKEGVT
jgi:hypothetical protein